MRSAPLSTSLALRLHFLALPLLSVPSLATAEIEGATWRYYRPGNTGIQGDYCYALHIDGDGNPWIGGHDPGFEEGGVAQYIQAENRWVNISNIDYPVIGHPDLTGTVRVSDIEVDAEGDFWMSTWRGVLEMDPDVGPSSLVNYAAASPAIRNGGCRDLDISPDGKIWFALLGFGGSMGGIVRHTPGTNDWHHWTGGNPPQGGNNWPLLVWTVESIAVQPKPGGGYVVWGDADNGASLVSFDSDTQLWTYHEFSFTAGSMLGMAGRNAVDESGNVWMQRFVTFQSGNPVYSLDYLRPDGTWVTPAQPSVAGEIWAFRAFGDRQALLVDGVGRVRRYNGSTWQDLGIWRDGSFSYDVNIAEDGTVWASGTGGAARRDPETGVWQRYRITNTSQFDYWNNDLAIDPTTGNVYACANAGPGFGGMTMFDGTRWIGFNEHTYGLGHPFPFPTDNSEAVAFRPSTGHVAVNPMFNGLHEWNGSSWTNLNGMSESVGLVEDSMGRLWSLGEYFELRYHNGSGWVSVPNNGAWGNNIVVDPDRAGTIWASTYAEIIRTDGSYRFSRTYDQFPELNTQSDIFGTVAAGPDGIAWLGSTQGMFRIDANDGSYEYFTELGGISCVGGSPLAVTPDGKVWFVMFDPGGWNGTPHGLCWFDGTDAGIYTTPVNGEPQWGGLPHAQLYDTEVHEIPGGYELWLSCASRGIAVLSVPMTDPASAPELVDATTDFGRSFGLPNPTSGPTTLHFELANAADVRVGIYDVGGRAVRDLGRTRLDAGGHAVLWDGRDADGFPVGSGVYFYRIDAGDAVLTRRLTVVR